MIIKSSCLQVTSQSVKHFTTVEVPPLNEVPNYLLYLVHLKLGPLDYVQYIGNFVIPTAGWLC